MSNQLERFNRSIALDVAAADQTLAIPSTGFYCQTAGVLVCRLRADAADSTFTGLLAGTVYNFEIIKVVKASTTVAGRLLFSN